MSDFADYFVCRRYDCGLYQKGGYTRFFKISGNIDFRFHALDTGSGVPAGSGGIWYHEHEPALCVYTMERLLQAGFRNIRMK